MNESEPTPRRSEPTTSNADPETNEYDLPVELFAGTIVAIMGVLVLITPLVTEMPSNWVWNPVLMNVISGLIYLLAGGFLVLRSR